MQSMLNHVHNTFDPIKVDAIAAQMQANDNDWKYVVRHDPKGTGKSIIQIFDENSEFVGLV